VPQAPKRVATQLKPSIAAILRCTSNMADCREAYRAILSSLGPTECQERRNALDWLFLPAEKDKLNCAYVCTTTALDANAALAAAACGAAATICSRILITVFNLS